MEMSNRQAHLADVVRGAVERYQRSSLEAHRAYLEAGAALVEARDGSKRGEWRPFLEAAGTTERTAQHMMTLARSGAKAETVSAFGGVKAMLRWLATARRCHKAMKAADHLTKHRGIDFWNYGIQPYHSALWVRSGLDWDGVPDMLDVRDRFGEMVQAMHFACDAGTWEPIDSIKDWAALIQHEHVAMFCGEAIRKQVVAEVKAGKVSSGSLRARELMAELGRGPLGLARDAGTGVVTFPVPGGLDDQPELLKTCTQAEADEHQRRMDRGNVQ